MTVRIGRIALTGVQDLHTEEARALVEQRAPEQQGGVTQDLGREPVTIVVVGLLYSADSLPDLEQLRTAQRKGEPQNFAADIAVGSEITQVVIAEARIQQLAGYASRYRYHLRLREYNPPPQSQQAARAKVQAKAAADGGNRAADGLKAAAVLTDPKSLPAALDSQPGLLKRLKAKDLAQALGRGLSSLNAEQVGGILSAVASRDPSKLGSVFQEMVNSGQLGGLLAKMSGSGLDLNMILKGMSLTSIGSVAQGMQQMLDVLKRLRPLPEKLQQLIQHIRTFAHDHGRLGTLLNALLNPSHSSTLNSTIPSSSDPTNTAVNVTASTLVKDTAALAADIKQVIDDELENAKKVAAILKVEAQLNKGIDQVQKGVQSLSGLVQDLAGWCGQADALLAGVTVLLGCFSGLQAEIDQFLGNLDNVVAKLTDESTPRFAPMGAQIQPLLHTCVNFRELIQAVALQDLPSATSLAHLEDCLSGLNQSLSKDSPSGSSATTTAAADTS